MLFVSLVFLGISKLGKNRNSFIIQCFCKLHFQRILHYKLITVIKFFEIDQFPSRNWTAIYTLKTRRKRRKKKISTNVQKFRNFLELILTQDQKLTFSISRIQIWVKVMGHRHVSTSFDDFVPSTYPPPKEGWGGGKEGEIFHGRKKRPSFPSTRNQLVRASFFPRIRA